MTDSLNRARQRADEFATTSWTVGIVGLGYVGLPLATTAARRGLHVVGYDVSGERIRSLQGGRSHVEDVTDGEVKQALADGVEFTSDEIDLQRADAILIAVPSPLGRNREPDMSYIESAAATVERVTRPGTLVVMESTTYPGTTDDLLVPAVRRAGLEIDENVWVAFSPERVDPGNPRRTAEIPKVVGGVTTASTIVARAAYERLVDDVYPVSSTRAAELTKLLENTYRAVNIALVNEIAQIAHVLDIDVWEVIEAASTKPFGFQAFYPGPGVGGHCISLDPQFLAWRAREVRVATRFIDLAEEINLHMPDYVVARVTDVLNDRGRPLFGTRILGVGCAYKRNVADDRESPALDVLQRLERRGAVVGVMDPHVEKSRIQGFGYQSVAPEDDLSDWTLAIVLTDHDNLDYERIATQVEIVFDTRGVYRRLPLHQDNVHRL